MNPQTKIIKRYGTCSKDCYGSCVFISEWNDQALERKLITVNALKKHPFTNGFLCPKFNQREDLLYNPNRLKSALLRSDCKGSNTFKDISLEAAVKIISKKLLNIKNQYGSSSIVAAYYAGNSGLLSQFAPMRFFNKLGATVSMGGICNEAGINALSQMFGNYSTTNPFQILNPNNKLIVVWGSNLSDRNNHAYFLVKKAIKNGSDVVVVNPIKTELAKNASVHLQPFPGTDYLIAEYIINKLLTRKKFDTDFLTQYVDNYDAILNKFQKVDETKILYKTGLTKDSLDAFLEKLLEFQHHTLFIVGFGPQKYIYGGKNLNSIALIQIILGNFGKFGTGFLFSQSGFNKLYTDLLLDYITQREVYPPQNSFPLVTLGSLLNSEEYKMLFVFNLNPASSLPNQTLLRKSLSRDDLYIVVLDMFLNETSKYADIVIPAKFDLECDDFITPYFVPGISINQGGPCPYTDCLSNYEFFQLLAKKCELMDDKILLETQESIFERCFELLPKEIQHCLKHNGFYIPFELNDIPYEDLTFPTPNGKIQIQDSIIELYNREPSQDRGQNEFFLLSPGHKYFIHSQMGEINKKFKEVFKKIYLNPSDIKSIGLKAKDEVFVSNKFCKGKFLLEQNHALKPGTALIYSGLPFANMLYKNANYFTSETPEESKLSGAYFSTIVKVSRA